MGNFACYPKSESLGQNLSITDLIIVLRIIRKKSSFEQHDRNIIVNTYHKLTGFDKKHIQTFDNCTVLQMLETIIKIKKNQPNILGELLDLCEMAKTKMKKLCPNKIQVLGSRDIRDFCASLIELHRFLLPFSSSWLKTPCDMSEEEKNKILIAVHCIQHNMIINEEKMPRYFKNKSLSMYSFTDEAINKVSGCCVLGCSDDEIVKIRHGTNVIKKYLSLCKEQL